MGKYADALLGPTAQIEAPKQGKYSEMLLGREAPMQAPSTLQEQPQGGGILQSIIGAIRGTQDPREANTGTVFEQFRDELTSPTATAATLGASDAQMGDIISSNLGDRVLRREKDASGNEIIVTRGPDGSEQRGYVNRPGLDTQDAWRAFYGAVPYVFGGGAIGAATKGANLGVQAITQAAGAGVISGVGDAVQMPLGSEQGIELEKAAATAAMGAAAPLVSAGAGSLWRRYVTVPGLYDRATGKLTQKGIAAAQRAGLNPADIEASAAEEFAKSFARTGDAMSAATESQVKPFGIPVSRGQVTKDPYLLTQEEKMRRRLYGEGAQDVMRNFDNRQMQAIKQAAIGGDGMDAPGPKRITEMIAPGRSPGTVEADRMAGPLGESIRGGVAKARAEAKTQETALWEDARNLQASEPALQRLPDAINEVFKNETHLTEGGKEAFKVLDQFTKGALPEEAVGDFKIVPGQNVDSMRRRIFAVVKSAATPEDKRQAGMAYDAFNDWIAQSAKDKLLIGEPSQAMNLIKARGFTKEVRELFSPTTAEGMKSPAAQRMAKIIDPAKADSGEGVIDAIFGSQGSQSVNNGAVTTLRNVKTMLDRFTSPEDAAQTWNDIRLAYWIRLVQRKNGELFGPQAMKSNINAAIKSQRSVLNTLYTPAEVREISNFARALEVVTYNPPNASGSGYTAAEAMNEGIARLLDTFGLGRVYRAGVGKYGIGDALATQRARSAVENIAGPTRRPPIAGPLIGAGSEYSRQRTADQ